jgi:virginiamycin B lyase
MLAVLVALGLAVIRPAAPTIAGPRVATTATPTYRFSSHERGVAAVRLRFRCSVDSPRLHACPARIRPRLSAGPHVLRAQAVDPAGRTSPVTRAAVTVTLAPLPPQAPAIHVGVEPVNVAFGAGSVWASNFGDGTVSRIDPERNAVVATIDIGGQPAGIAAGDGAVWVGNFQGGALAKIDPATNAVVARVDTGGQPVGPALADGALWVSNYAGSVQRVDPATNRVVATVPVAGNPEVTALGFGLVWSTNQDGTITTIDPATNARVGAPIRVADDVDGISIDASGVWVVTFYDGVLARIDPTTRAVAFRTTLGGRGGGVLVAGGSVWATVYDGALLQRHDPSTGRLVGSVRVGVQPREIASGAGSLWVVNQVSDSVSRVAP